MVNDNFKTIVKKALHYLRSCAELDNSAQVIREKSAQWIIRNAPLFKKVFCLLYKVCNTAEKESFRGDKEPYEAT